MKKQYIIIGTSAAGLSAAIKIRSIDQNCSIICISAEKEMPYNRCLLADHLSGAKTVEQIATKSQSFFDEQNIKLVLGKRVTAIDRVQRIVKTDTDESLYYDALFIGTGRSGWIPNTPGSSLAGVFPFYGLSDSTAILEYIHQNNVTNVVVVGAGLSGLECADALANIGLKVTVVERALHALPWQLDVQGGAFLQQLMMKKHVDILTNLQITEIQGSNGAVRAALLSNDTLIQTQMLIFAIGGKINSEIAQKADLTIHNYGIVVNKHMQTNDPAIYAGGDVCVVKDMLTGELIQSCLWPDAALQGLTAGSCMAGQERRYPGTLVITSSTIYGTTFVTCGQINNIPADFKKIIRSGSDFYHTFVTHNDQLKGFCMIGRVDNVGMLRKTILEKKQFIP